MPPGLRAGCARAGFAVRATHPSPHPAFRPARILGLKENAAADGIGRFAALCMSARRGRSFALGRGVDGAPQGGARFEAMALAKPCGARRQRCCALRRSISPRLFKTRTRNTSRAFQDANEDRLARVRPGKFFEPHALRCGEGIPRGCLKTESDCEVRRSSKSTSSSPGTAVQERHRFARLCPVIHV